MSDATRRRLPSIPTGYVFTLLIASAVAAWRLPYVADMAVAVRLQNWTSDAFTIVTGAVPIVVTLLPFLVAAAFWPVLPRGMRMGALGILALLAAPLAHRTAGYVDSLARGVANDRRVAADLAPMREAMRVPPEVAARRAIAAGNRELLVIGGDLGIISGLRNVCAVELQGWMLIRGTGDYFSSRGHLGFQAAAARYAERYNDELISALGLDRAELEREVVDCSGTLVDRDAPRRYWPDGAEVRSMMMWDGMNERDEQH